MDGVDVDAGHAQGLYGTRRAIERLGAAERMFEASLTELEGTGMPAKSAQFIADGRAYIAAENEAKRVAEVGGSFLTPEDEVYPERLRQIYDPPAVLWIRGDAALLARPGIAVVETRQPSPYGAPASRSCCRASYRDAGCHHHEVCMARGVDDRSTQGRARRRRQDRKAVWGHGHRRGGYPKENKKLAESIVASGGTIVSEYPLGTFPAPQNFPVRNSILSGMSVGVLVIEAGEYSGTRITARCAMEQNRDVFAVPGNVTNKNLVGTQHL